MGYEESFGSVLLGSGITFPVPVELGIVLPYTRIDINLPALTIAAHTTQGSLQEKMGSIAKSPGLITLNWRKTEISFSPQVAGQPTQIWFGFTSSDPLRPGDVISLKLPHFVGTSKDCFSTIATFPQDAITSASWDSTKEELLFRVSNYLTANQQVWALVVRVQYA